MTLTFLKSIRLLPIEQALRNSGPSEGVPLHSRRRGRLSSVAVNLGKPLPLIAGFAVIVAVWQVAVIVFKPDAAVLPTPAATAHTFWSLLISGELLEDARISIMRVMAAWLISGAIAIPLGLAMGWSRRIERLIDPLIEIFRPISPMAWIPLAILWFGINEPGKIFVVCIATFFPTLLATIDGVKRIDRVLIHAGQVLGCTDNASLFRKVILPAAFPSILVGLRISFGTGWAAIIAAELVAARSGLGFLIANGMDILRADKVIVGMGMIGLLGVCFDAAFRYISRKAAWS